MDPTQFMLPMPSMIPPHLLPPIPTSTAPAAVMPMDVLGMWANGKRTARTQVNPFILMNVFFIFTLLQAAFSLSQAATLLCCCEQENLL